MWKVKLNSANQVVKLKSRFVAQGCFERASEEDNYYSPVVTRETLRYLLDWSVHEGSPIHSMDISNAFLQSSINKTYYIADIPAYPAQEDMLHVFLRRKTCFEGSNALYMG